MAEATGPIIRQLPELIVFGSEYSFEIDIYSFFESNFSKRITFVSDAIRLKRFLDEVSQQHKRLILFIPANRNICWDLKDPGVRKNFLELHPDSKLLPIVELKFPEDFIPLLDIPFLKKALRVMSTHILTRRDEVFNLITLLSDDFNLGNLLERRIRNLRTETRQSIGSPPPQRSLSDFEKLAELEEGDSGQISFLTFTEEELEENMRKVSRDFAKAKTLRREVLKPLKVPRVGLDRNALLSISEADLEPLPVLETEETETIDYLPIDKTTEYLLIHQSENKEET